MHMLKEALEKEIHGQIPSLDLIIRLTKIFLNLCSISDDRRTSGQGFSRVEDIKAGFAQIQVFIPTRFSCSPGE